MKHAKTAFSTEMCAGAIISVVQYLALLRVQVCHMMYMSCRRTRARASTLQWRAITFCPIYVP
jgi:hypothetical protein